MKTSVLITVLFLLGITAPHAQNLDAGQIARNISSVNKLPVASVLADLVTKSSSNAIQSGLATPYFSSSPTGVDPFSILKGQASQQGYILRDVELDSRFQRNVARIAAQISLTDLSKPSSAGGFIASVPGQRGSDIASNFSQIIGGPNSVINNPGQLFGDDRIEFPGAADAAAAASPVDDNQNGRIFGGTPVPTSGDVFPETVAITGNDKLCSGVLVASDLVLTAAHCFCDGVLDEADFGTSILSPKDRIKIDKENSQVFRPCDELKADMSLGDIALLKLKTKALTPPRALGALKTVKDAASVRAVGFGRTSTKVGFKYQVNIIITSYQCDGTAFSGLPDQQVFRCRPSFELVAAGLNRDTCSGDSGGPIYVFGEDAKPYVVGITSRAINPSGACGGGGIYVLFDVSPVHDWLAQRGVAFN